MPAPEIINKGLVVLCMFTQVVSAAGMIILLDLYATANTGGTNFGMNYMILLVYGFIAAVIITLTDVIQPKFWYEHVTVFRYFGGRTLLYIPFGALNYADFLKGSGFDKVDYLLVSIMCFFCVCVRGCVDVFIHTSSSAVN